MVSHLSPVILQHDLDGLFKWSMDWHMTFNVAKCKTLHFSKKKFPTDQSQYHLGGQPLERVSVIKDLGVSVCCDLQWGRYIAEIVSKSNKILGLIKRVCKDMSNTQTRKVLCYTLIRPRQEYCCSLWSPHTAKDRALIKNVQRRATKIILNYPHDCCYVDRLTSLKLLLLEYRRNVHDLTLLFKLNAVSWTLITLNSVLQQLATITRAILTQNNFDVVATHRQTYFRSSFFPCSVNIWNNLPSALKNCPSLSSLKTALSNLYLSKLQSHQPP